MILCTMDPTVADDGINECQNCCIYCQKKNICQDVCEEIKNLKNEEDIQDNCPFAD